MTPDTWLERVEKEMAHVIEDTYHRYQMMVVSLSALHRSVTAVDLEAAIRGVERKPIDAIRGGML